MTTLVYYKDKAFCSPTEDFYEAMLEVKNYLELREELVYDEETCQGKLGNEPISAYYVDSITEV